MPKESFKVKDLDTDKPTVVTIEDIDYNLNDGGDAIDKEGNIFKTKAELAEPIKPIVKDIDKDEFGEVTIADEKFKLDKDGNVLDSEGKVKHTKDEYTELSKKPVEEEIVTKEVVAINDIEYELNDNGDAIDDKGEVAYTKDAMDKMKDAGEESSADISKLMETTGISITDEDGTVVEYAEGDEGTKNYVIDVYNKGAEEHSQDAIQELYDTHPMLRKIVKHLELNNGVLDGFNQTVNYSDVEIDKTNEKQLELINLQYFLSRGHSQEEAERFINYSKADKKLFDDAEKHLGILQKEQEDFDKQQDDLLEQRKVTEQKSNDKYRGFSVEKGKLIDLKQENSVYDKIVNKGMITIDNSTLEIPKTLRVNSNGKVKNIDRSQLINYAFTQKVQVVNGQKVMATDYEVYLHNKQANRTVDHDILELINAITGNDMSQLVEQKVKSNEVKRVRNLVTKSKKRQVKVDLEKDDSGKIKQPWNK